MTLTKEEKYQKRRLRSSYIVSVVSISIVLFLLGWQGIILGYAGKLGRYMKENVGFNISINEQVKETDILNLEKQLKKLPYVKSTQYINKDEAAKTLTAELGEDFVGFLGYNPLLASIDVRVFADYANNDSLAKFEKELRKLPEVKEVYYQKMLVQELNENVKKISRVILIFGLLVLLIAIALIYNTVRLSIYSKRLLIKSMLLVGATSGFIQKPFLKKSIIQGIISALIADALLMISMIYAQKKMPELISSHDMHILFILFAGILVFGILFTWISSYFAIRKFLKMNTEQINF